VQGAGKSLRSGYWNTDKVGRTAYRSWSCREIWNRCAWCPTRRQCRCRRHPASAASAAPSGPPAITSIEHMHGSHALLSVMLPQQRILTHLLMESCSHTALFRVLTMASTTYAVSRQSIAPAVPSAMAARRRGHHPCTARHGAAHRPRTLRPHVIPPHDEQSSRACRRPSDECVQHSLEAVKAPQRRFDSKI